jgi:hypothetical protein
MTVRQFGTNDFFFAIPFLKNHPQGINPEDESLWLRIHRRLFNSPLSRLFFIHHIYEQRIKANYSVG